MLNQYVQNYLEFQIYILFLERGVAFVDVGSSQKSNNSKWWAPYFAQSKHKTNQVRFLSSFINLNKNWL